jgi:hypothetical protein
MNTYTNQQEDQGITTRMGMDVDVDGDDDDEDDASSSKDPCRCRIDALCEFPLWIPSGGEVS